MQFLPGQRIHCIGIGGFGISAIARVLLLRGFSISGSDQKENKLTEALARDGATIYHGHSPDYVTDVDMVIATSAVGDDHIEIITAKERDIPVYRRRDILAPLMEDQKVIAVAGTHGKTTTTSLIIHILRECGKDPSYIVGGVMANTGTNAGVGKDNIFVIEADEYGNMFLGLKPDIAVITNIEFDHPDFFETIDDVYHVFDNFADLLTRHGYLVGCGDDIYVETVMDQLEEKNWQRPGDEWLWRSVIAYGLEDGDAINILATDIQFGETGISEFKVELVARRGLRGTVATIRFPLMGKHNVQNALAALTVANLNKISFGDAAKALETFKPIGRRFEVQGEVNGVTVIDDYAHHPTAVKITLEAARMRYPHHQIWAVWQPHMYSRTKKLIYWYATAFADADHVIVTDIYAAREAPIEGVTGEWVSTMLEHSDVHHTPLLADAVELLSKDVKSPAILLILSAGDAPQIGINYLKAMRDETD